jgi:hypothetical protein
MEAMGDNPFHRASEQLIVMSALCHQVFEWIRDAHHEEAVQVHKTCTTPHHTTIHKQWLHVPSVTVCSINGCS